MRLQMGSQKQNLHIHPESMSEVVGAVGGALYSNSWDQYVVNTVHIGAAATVTVRAMTTQSRPWGRHSM